MCQYFYLKLIHCVCLAQDKYFFIGVKYDAEKEQKSAFEAKQKQLQRLEEVRAKKRSNQIIFVSRFKLMCFQKHYSI